MITFSIRRDTFNGTRCPWAADYENTDDGSHVKSWAFGFKTARSLKRHIRSVMGDDARIVRGEDVTRTSEAYRAWDRNCPRIVGIESAVYLKGRD